VSPAEVAHIRALQSRQGRSFANSLSIGSTPSPSPLGPQFNGGNGNGGNNGSAATYLNALGSATRAVADPLTDIATNLLKSNQILARTVAKMSEEHEASTQARKQPQVQQQRHPDTACIHCGKYGHQSVNCRNKPIHAAPPSSDQQAMDSLNKRLDQFLAGIQQASQSSYHPSQQQQLHQQYSPPSAPMLALMPPQQSPMPVRQQPAAMSHSNSVPLGSGNSGSNGRALLTPCGHCGGSHNTNNCFKFLRDNNIPESDPRWRGMGRGGPRSSNPDGKVNLVHLDADVTSDDSNIMNIQERIQVINAAVPLRGLHE
jgi:hypothetical protein